MLYNISCAVIVLVNWFVLGINDVLMLKISVTIFVATTLAYRYMWLDTDAMLKARKVEGS